MTQTAPRVTVPKTAGMADLLEAVERLGAQIGGEVSITYQRDGSAVPHPGSRRAAQASPALRLGWHQAEGSLT